MSFTKAQKKKYLKNPDVCPYCGSEEISGDHFDADYKDAWRTVECRSCEREWREIFTMIDVEEQE